MTFPGADRIQAQTTDLLAQGQKATAELVGAVTSTWSDAMRQWSGTATGTGLPTGSAEAVDRFFDAGIQVLEAQRAFAHSMLGAVRPMVEFPDARR